MTYGVGGNDNHQGRWKKLKIMKRKMLGTILVQVKREIKQQRMKWF